MLKQSLVDVLTKAVKIKAITEKHAKLLASLPLVEIGDIHPEANTEWSRFVAIRPTIELTLKDPTNDVFLSRDDFIFLSAIYDIPRYGFYRITLHPVPEENVPTKGYSADFEYFPADGIVINPIVLATLTYDPDLTSPLKVLTATVKGSKVIIDAKDIVVEAITEVLAILRIFVRFQESLDRYPVEVRNTRPRLSRGNMNRVDKQLGETHRTAPRLIYLNQLPHVSNSISNVTGEPTGPRAMHQRVGHWKTLTHPKFKNHPKFGIKNGVRVKPSWVGIREASHEGNVYRVIFKDS